MTSELHRISVPPTAIRRVEKAYRKSDPPYLDLVNRYSPLGEVAVGPRRSFAILTLEQMEEWKRLTNECRTAILNPLLTRIMQYSVIDEDQIIQDMLELAGTYELDSEILIEIEVDRDKAMAYSRIINRALKTVLNEGFPKEAVTVPGKRKIVQEAG